MRIGVRPILHLRALLVHLCSGEAVFESDLVVFLARRKIRWTEFAALLLFLRFFLLLFLKRKSGIFESGGIRWRVRWNPVDSPLATLAFPVP